MEVEGCQDARNVITRISAGISEHNFHKTETFTSSLPVYNIHITCDVKLHPIFIPMKYEP